MNDIAFLDATAQAGLVRSKQLSATELVTSAIERIEALNPTLNAVIHPMFEQARTAANAPASGPFSGVPFQVKDLVAECQGKPRALRWSRNV